MLKLQHVVLYIYIFETLSTDAKSIMSTHNVKLHSITQRSWTVSLDFHNNYVAKFVCQFVKSWLIANSILASNVEPPTCMRAKYSKSSETWALSRVLKEKDYMLTHCTSFEKSCCASLWNCVTNFLIIKATNFLMIKLSFENNHLNWSQMGTIAFSTFEMV
jgi:hypothetical protein